MKRAQKFFAIFFAVIITVITVFPLSSMANGDNLTLTVSGEVAGRTLSLYKLFHLNEDNGSYYYTWDDLASEQFFESKGYDTIIKATDYLKTLKNDSTQLTNLAEEYYTYCCSKGIKEIDNINVINRKTADVSDKEVKFNGLEKGYYLVYDETTISQNQAKSAAMISSLKENTEIKLKADSIEVKKEADTHSANVGDTVNFTITSKVPEMIGYNTYTFKVEDTLSKGLTLKTVEEKPEITIKIGGENYTGFTSSAELNRDGTTTLTIDFVDFISQKENAGKQIEIKYSAILNKDAAIEKDNKNNVKIIYSNNPTTDSKGESNKEIVHVYTYSLDLTKKNSEGAALSGAQFVLKLANGNYAKFNEDNVYNGFTNNIEEATKLTTDSQEKVYISGLKEGSYSLIERVAPEGYNKPNFAFDFTISQKLKDDGTLDTATFDYTTDERKNSAKGYLKDQTNTEASFEIEILNSKSGLLPSTGGTGTIIFTAVGITVMAIAGVSYVVYTRKKRGGIG